MTTMTGSWTEQVHRVDAATRLPDGVLSGLVRGDVAVVVLRGLLPAAVFRGNRERVRSLFHRRTTTRYRNGALTTIGPYLAKHLDRPDRYFTEAAGAAALLSGAGVDLADRVRARLREVLGLARLEPAREPDGRRYPPGVVRIHADGVSNPLHNDNIMRDAAGTGLAVAGLRYQLSCVVCIEECTAGGELVTHRRSWTAGDERFKVAGELGYRPEVTRGAASHEFRPRAGDVYLINPTYYHEIKRVAGADRVTLGFFIGFPDGELTEAVVWG
jgi:hypothetical protein